MIEAQLHMTKNSNLDKLISLLCNNNIATLINETSAPVSDFVFQVFRSIECGEIIIDSVIAEKFLGSFPADEEDAYGLEKVMFNAILPFTNELVNSIINHSSNNIWVDALIKEIISNTKILNNSNLNKKIIALVNALEGKEKFISTDSYNKDFSFVEFRIISILITENIADLSRENIEMIPQFLKGYSSYGNRLSLELSKKFKNAITPHLTNKTIESIYGSTLSELLLDYDTDSILKEYLFDYLVNEYKTVFVGRSFSSVKEALDNISPRLPQDIPASVPYHDIRRVARTGTSFESEYSKIQHSNSNLGKIIVIDFDGGISFENGFDVHQIFLILNFALKDNTYHLLGILDYKEVRLVGGIELSGK